MVRPLSTSRVAVPVLAAALAGACLVKDVELVQQFSDGGKNHGGNTSSAGSPSTGGNNSSGDGGEDAAAGDGSGGSQPSAGSGGSPAGGMNQGGAGGMNPGGMAGMHQGGSNTPVEIPELDVCNDPAHLFCDDFEQGSTGNWPPGVEPQLSLEAPSGDFVLVRDFQQPVSLAIELTVVSISLWAKFSGLYDQRIISFRDVNGQFLFGLGREATRARWIYGEEANPDTIVAPDDVNLTRSLDPEQWVCIQIRADLFANSFEARVVVPGEPPFDLPTLDTNPTTGVDEVWNTSIVGWSAAPDELVFGQEGSYTEFDDVLIGEYDAQTVCDRFIAAGN